MRILIHGYDNINIGDDLFFQILTTKYPNVEFFMISTKDYGSIINRPNFKCIKSNFFNRVCRKLNIIPYQLLFIRFDAIIVIGGSIFMEIGQSGSCGSIVNIQRYKRWFSKTPIHIIGSNYGPSNTDKFEVAVSELFKIVDSVCLRDSYSYNFFKDNPKVSFASDVVFQLHRKDREKKTYNTIGISIINLENRPSLIAHKNSYIKLIKEIINISLSKNNHIKLFSFCENEGDYDACNEILNSYDNTTKNKIEIVNYTGDIDNFLKEFNKVDKLYATRYHAVILGLLYQIPMTPLVYSNKILYALNNIGDNIPYIDIRVENNTDPNQMPNFIMDNETLQKVIACSRNQFKSINKLVQNDN